MEYKICENCNEKLHVRTQKCPFCSTILTENSQIIKEVDEEINNNPTEENNGAVVEFSDDRNDAVSEEKMDLSQPQNTLPEKEVKDYVYKAEVRHSLEYTKLMSNGLKVFLSAISMIPVIGQCIGTFFGVFFLTCDDYDRKSFGRALICLSIIMFFIYVYNVLMFEKLLEAEGLTSLMQGIQ